MEEFWIFGYGSLVWKPPPYFDLRLPGYIEGYTRRFWQASEDHRGTPESPGRVVTLIRQDTPTEATDPAINPTTQTSPEEQQTPRVYGAAYRIPPAHIPAVQSYLDIREINGYSIDYVPFFPLPSPTTNSQSLSPTTPSRPSATPPPAPRVIGKCMLYIGLPKNPQYVGPESLDATARVIATSRGPSGWNWEYLYRLEEGLRGLGERDGYVGELVGRVRALRGEGEGERDGGEGSRIGGNGDGDGKEEVEKGDG